MTHLKTKNQYFPKPSKIWPFQPEDAFIFVYKLSNYNSCNSVNYEKVVNTCLEDCKNFFNSEINFSGWTYDEIICCACVSIVSCKSLRTKPTFWRPIFELLKVQDTFLEKQIFNYLLFFKTLYPLEISVALFYYFNLFELDASGLRHRTETKLFFSDFGVEALILLSIGRHKDFPRFFDKIKKSKVFTILKKEIQSQQLNLILIKVGPIIQTNYILFCTFIKCITNPELKKEIQLLQLTVGLSKVISIIHINYLLFYILVDSRKDPVLNKQFYKVFLNKNKNPNSFQIRLFTFLKVVGAFFSISVLIPFVVHAQPSHSDQLCYSVANSDRFSGNAQPSRSVQLSHIVESCYSNPLSGNVEPSDSAKLSHSAESYPSDQFSAQPLSSAQILYSAEVSHSAESYRNDQLSAQPLSSAELRRSARPSDSVQPSRSTGRRRSARLSGSAQPSISAGRRRSARLSVSAQPLPLSSAGPRRSAQRARQKNTTRCTIAKVFAAKVVYPDLNVTVLPENLIVSPESLIVPPESLIVRLEEIEEYLNPYL